MTQHERRELLTQTAEFLDSDPDMAARIQAAWDATERLLCPATAADIEIIRAALTVPLSTIAAVVDDATRMQTETAEQS